MSYVLHAFNIYRNLRDQPPKIKQAPEPAASPIEAETKSRRDFHRGAQPIAAQVLNRCGLSYFRRGHSYAKPVLNVKHIDIKSIP
ncbi:hypothetical protein [Thalassovita taeanensis]|uniref:hypothetical protein n=1 Tax=Thalassovita taeanensis TaxID=657014 RepID=UPI001114C0FD|nr:hypothetical protein [Thalassovita taeanensis]